MKKGIVPAAAAGAAVLVLIACGALFFNRPSRDALRVSGNIEVTCAVLSFRISGRLQERLVEEGQHVAAGQLIARLDRSDEELAVQKARAQLSYAEAVLQEMESGSRDQEIRDARAQMEKAQAASRAARAEMERSRADDRRYQELFREGVISAREYDTFHTRLETSRSTYEETMAWIQSAQEQLSLRAEGFRKEQIAQAGARVRIEKESLRQALQRLQYTDLHAPFDGVVLSKSSEKGEYLNSGSPVVTIGDLERPWLRAYVNETDLGRIRLGHKASVTTDTFPGKTYPGRISFISSEAEFTPKSVQTFEERVKLVYRIKIELPNPRHELKPGMPADALIVPRDGSE